MRYWPQFAPSAGAMSKRLISASGVKDRKAGGVAAAIPPGVGQCRGKPLNVGTPSTRKSSQCGAMASAIPGLGFCVSNIWRTSCAELVRLPSPIQFIMRSNEKLSRIERSVTAKERLALGARGEGGGTARGGVAALL